MPGNRLREVQSLIGSTAKNHTPTPDERNGHIPRTLPTQEDLDCRPIATPSFKNKDQVAGAQVRWRIKGIGWSVGYQINITNPQPTVTVSWRLSLAVSTHRNRYGHHTRREAAHGNSHPTFAFAEQQLHVPLPARDTGMNPTSKLIKATCRNCRSNPHQLTPRV